MYTAVRKRCKYDYSIIKVFLKYFAELLLCNITKTERKPDDRTSDEYIIPNCATIKDDRNDLLLAIQNSKLTMLKPVNIKSNQSQSEKTSGGSIMDQLKGALESRRPFLEGLVNFHFKFILYLW